MWQALGGIGAALGLGQAAGSAGVGIGNTLVNINQARLQRQFQRDMSGTAYQRAMADMRAAGLNPMLAYQQGGASSPPGAAATGAFQAPDIGTAYRMKLDREEQNNRNARTAADVKLTEAKATKEGASVPAYEFGREIMDWLKPYAKQVLDHVKANIDEWTRNPTKAADDLLDWARKKNLGVTELADPKKALTAVGTAAKDVVTEQAEKVGHSAKRMATDQVEILKDTVRRSYLLQKHPTRIDPKDPAIRRLPGVPKD